MRLSPCVALAGQFSNDFAEATDSAEGGGGNDGSGARFQGDFRELTFEEGAYDVILAAAVLHHLRSDADWEAVFRKIHCLLRPGGSFWVSDLVTHEVAAVDRMMWARYGSYLEGVGGAAYRDDVFAYIDQEDSPRPLAWQLDLLRKVGFVSVDVLHKNSCFAVFGGLKGPCCDVFVRTLASYAG